MKAIVGLGNPGSQYAGTRHNIGFDVVEEVARRWGVQLRPWKSVAEVATVGSRGAVLVEPVTFMNLSGDAVSQVGRRRSIHASMSATPVAAGKATLQPASSGTTSVALKPAL